MSLVRKIKISEIIEIVLSKNDNDLLNFINNIFDNLIAKENCYLYDNKLMINITDIILVRWEYFWEVIYRNLIGYDDKTKKHDESKDILRYYISKKLNITDKAIYSFSGKNINIKELEERLKI